MNAISYYEHYNNEMSKGLEDKLFFMNKINVRNILDYGCADGSLIYEMRKYFPEKHYVGYDLDHLMIDIANHHLQKNCHFYDNLSRANMKLRSHQGNNMVLCSSLIHEVYSYGNTASINSFWDNLYCGNYDYVVIRDMALSENEVSDTTLSDINDVRAVYELANPVHLNDFINIWGDIHLQKNLLHFLFKYRYTQNWKREVEENYFPVSIQEHLSKITDKYEMIHFEHYLLPFQKDIIKSDFGIDVNNRTHLKMILKKIE